ncbi:MAG: methylated-DNA--[protein]-cysteine S-methyltransferase [Euryarchaeota archaeon]|nr:methylated-DNA--[protein]-cysteine S-methyltransferase [Euryarchaeota archaeon]
MPTKVNYSVFESPVGPLGLATTDKALVRLNFLSPREDFGETLRADGFQVSRAETPMLRRAARELTEYFAGKRRDFTVPVDFLEGTEFQKNVWRHLQEIPYGSTCSYKALANACGSENGFRAVGSANGSNPVAIVVPCHRVIAADGSMGGYGAGLPTKARLLALERGERLDIAPGRMTRQSAYLPRF